MRIYRQLPIKIIIVTLDIDSYMCYNSVSKDTEIGDEVSIYVQHVSPAVRTYLWCESVGA